MIKINCTSCRRPIAYLNKFEQLVGPRLCVDCRKSLSEDGAEFLHNKIIIQCDNCGESIDGQPHDYSGYGIFCDSRCFKMSYQESEEFDGEDE